MATLGSIRTSLQTRVKTVTSLANRVYDVWPDKILLPCAIVRPTGESFHETFDGDSTISFEIVILAAPAQDGLARGQAVLDGYLAKTGTNSVKAAIEADRKLGSTVDETVCRGWSDYGTLEVNGIEYVGAKLMIVVEYH